MRSRHGVSGEWEGSKLGLGRDECAQMMMSLEWSRNRQCAGDARIMLAARRWPTGGTAVIVIRFGAPRLPAGPLGSAAAVVCHSGSLYIYLVHSVA